MYTHHVGVGRILSNGLCHVTGIKMDDSLEALLGKIMQLLFNLPIRCVRY